MITIEKLSCGYDGIVPVKELSAVLPEHGLVAIYGPSGCGKTTLLKCIAGLIEPLGGEVKNVPERRSMIFQEDRLLPWLSIYGNIAIVRPEGDVAACIAAVELADSIDKPIAELSGGMQRRVAIARAMNYGGEVLFMDEPMKGLDEALAKRVMQRLREAFPLVIMTAHGPVAEADALIAL